MSNPNEFPNGPGEGGDQDMCSFIASFFRQRQSIDRLLDWLRESQTACTDTNCFDDINGLPGSEIGQSIDPSISSRQGAQAADVDNLTPLLWLFLGLITFILMTMNRRREGSSVMD